MWNAIKKVLEDWKWIRRDTILKFNIRKIKELIFGEYIETDLNDSNNDVYLEWETLFFSNREELYLETDNLFIKSLLCLSGKNVKKLFQYLENIIVCNNIPWTSNSSIIAWIIQKSEERNLHIKQKILVLRKNVEWAVIQKKFIDNNLNVWEFRSFLLWNIIKVEDTNWSDCNPDWEKGNWIDWNSNPNLDSWAEENIKTFNFKFGTDVAQIFKIEFNWKKDIKAFILSFNSFISQYCKNQEMENFIEPFTVKDFKGIELVKCPPKNGILKGTKD